MTSPSTTISPFSVRALWVARWPHQHRASTWRACTRSPARPAGPTGEHLGAEVGQDPEREHVDLQVVDHLGQLVDLVAGVELGLVADQVVDPAPAGQLVDDVPPEVEVVGHLDGLDAEAEPRRQRGLARPVVAGEDPADATAGRVVVVGLQREGRLA
jgi:hypothetical protein